MGVTAGPRQRGGLWDPVGMAKCHKDLGVWIKMKPSDTPGVLSSSLDSRHLPTYEHLGSGGGEGEGDLWSSV
jgi:hypothetical protein